MELYPFQQVFMLQPITVAGENGESQVIQQQLILPEGATLEQLQAQGLTFDQQVLVLPSLITFKTTIGRCKAKICYILM